MSDEIRLVIPADEDFRQIAHLVVSGLALRLDLTYDSLEDLQVAVEALLGLRDDQDDVVVAVHVEQEDVRVAVGPLPVDAVEELDRDGPDFGLRRVLATVSDAFRVSERDDGCWVELTKRTATAAGAAGS
jgi:anti-sigma regulatory factor (Ser/Thr protein kinase)